MSQKHERAVQQLHSAAAEAHYNHLTAYFHDLVKYTGGAIGIIVAIGSFLFYTNLRDVRNEAAAVARSTAIAESKIRVEEAFKENNMNTLIEKVAQQKIATVTDKQIQKQFDEKLEPITDRIEAFGKISASETRMRLGFRSGYTDLISIISSTRDEQTKRFAQSSLSTTSQHFELRWKVNLAGGDKAVNFVVSETDGPADLPRVVRLIRKEDNINTVAIAFLAFRELTGAKAPMFDMASVEKWCAANKPKCD